MDDMANEINNIFLSRITFKEHRPFFAFTIYIHNVNTIVVIFWRRLGIYLPVAPVKYLLSIVDLWTKFNEYNFDLLNLLMHTYFM